MNDLQTERLIAAFEKIAAALSSPAPASAAAAPEKVKPAAVAKAVEAKTVVAKKPDPVEEPSFDYEVLKANTVGLASSGAAGKGAIVGVLKKLGVTGMKELPPSRWEEANEAVLAAKASVEEADVA